MKVLEKKVLAHHEPGRAPLCAGIAYIDAEKPVLLRRLGWEVSDDIHDGYTDAFSHDNGRTWSEPRPALQSTPVENGVIVHTENAFLYLEEQDKLFHFTNDKMETDLSAGHSSAFSAEVRITSGSPQQVSTGENAETFISGYGLKQGLYVSFCAPIRDSRGRILVPVQWQKIDSDGSIQGRGFPARPDMPNVMMDVWEVGLLIGEPQTGGQVQWHLGQAVPCEFEKSSRGMCEGTVTELGDGKLAMILRGSNAAWPDRPSYKWLSFSEDGGETWSETQPLAFDDGTVFESSATGSTLIRSNSDGRLYWLGNLCADGQRAEGNFPRSPLFIAEVQEQPFALKRATLTEIDRHQPGEDPRVQLSNFKVHQDRKTNDLVVHLTRYGEHGADGKDWINADLHQYRVGLD